jgi:hypothetical protein
MRLLFGVLLAVSVLLFVAIQWGGALTGATKGNQANGELNPDKIILLGMPAAKQEVAAPVSPAHAMLPASAPLAVTSAPAAAPATTNAAAQKQIAPAAPNLQVAPKLQDVPQESAKASSTAAATKSEQKVCVEWGEFSGTDLARAEKQLAALKLGDRLSQHTVEYDSGYWVYIPPLKNKAAINRKIAELKAAGIDEYFVLKEGRKWHNAISLGVFKSEDSARQLLAAVRKKGLHSAKVGERKGKLKYIVFRINEMSSDEMAHLNKLHKDFPNSDLKKTTCKAR